MYQLIVYLLFMVPVLAYPNQEFSQHVMSWNSTEIEFRIPRNYPKNVPIFSIQVLQLPDYPIGSDVAQVVCNRLKRNSSTKKANSRNKRDIKESKTERRRGKRTESFMEIINSDMSNTRATRSHHQSPLENDDNRNPRRDNTKTQESQANVYRSRKRFRLVDNSRKLFKLSYDNKKSLLSLELQRSLNSSDYVHVQGNFITVTLSMEECDKRKGKRTVDLHYVKLHIIEPFQCKRPTENMCMMPSTKLFLRQWENRGPSPLLVLPSLVQFCPKLRRHISIKMTDFNQELESELAYYEEENAFYNNLTLDRESSGSKVEYSVSCRIKGQEDYADAHMTLSGELYIEDENDSPPVASRDPYIVWEYIRSPEGSKSRRDKSIYELTNKIFVVDPDLIKNNDFSLTIEGFDFKDDAVQRTIEEYGVQKNYCYNETSSLKSPLNADCTIINPSLVFDEYIISQINQSSINFALVFRDNSLLNTKGSDDVNKVTYNITMILTGTSSSNQIEFDHMNYYKEIGTNITVSRPAQKYARLGKIVRVMALNTSKLSDTTKFELVSDNINQGVDITPLDGILYISNPTQLENALDQKASLEITIKIKSKMVKKVFLTWSDETCSRKNLGTCAKHDLEDDCLSSCGLGSTSKCKWRQLKGSFSTPHYATCSPEIGLCPDGHCDEHEKLDKMICPQDCMDEGKMKNKDKNLYMNEQTSPPLGIASGFGVCSCDDFCQCFPVGNNTNSRHLPKNPGRKTITEGYASSHCDSSCQIGISCFFIPFCVVVGIVVYMKRKQCNGKYKGDLGRSNNPVIIDDHSSSYVPGNAHGEAHVMALHAVRNNSPRQNNNNQDLLSDIPLANFSIDKKWEFPREKLTVEKTLGEGEFGRVMKAKAYEINNTSGFSVVAVKMLKNNSTPAELVDLLSEFDLLKEVSHPNVIRLLGACTTKGGPVYLIMEFCKYGSLRTYLRRSRHFELENRVGAALIEEHGIDYHVTPKDILSFVWQICKGMTYLTNMKLVHRDLAARNILLAEEKICKISDFGLTRDIYEGDLYFKKSKGRVPVKWMAPESLADHVYTHKSDVWSFGVLLWELVTLGSSPYPGVTPERLFTLLKSGHRMEKPENCSTELYQVMRDCWSENQERRPTFTLLTQTFENMIQADVEYLELRSLIVTNRLYFDNDTNKLDAKENKIINRTGSSLDNIRICAKDGLLKTDKDSYLLAKPVNATATFPPTPSNPRIHAHNPAYSPGEVNPMRHQVPLQYSMLLDVPDEEEDAKEEIEEQQIFNQSEWDSDSGRTTGDSGYITEDNKKILGSRNGSVPGNFTASLKPLKKYNRRDSPAFPYDSEEQPLTTQYDILVGGSSSGILTPSPSISGGSNRISLSNSSIRDGIMTPDSLMNTPKAVKRSPIIV